MIKHYILRIKDGALKDMAMQLMWIYGYAKRHILFIVLYTLLGLTGTVISLFSGLVSRDLVDIITGHQTGKLLVSFCLIILTQLLSTAITHISSFISVKITSTVENDIKADIYDKIMHTEWEALSQFHSGDIISRWAGSSSLIASGMLNTAPNLVIGLFKFSSALYMVCRYDVSFAIFALLSVPISISSSRGSLRRMKKTNMLSYETNTRMSAFTQDSFTSIQTVKAFDMVGSYSKKLRDLLKDMTTVKLKYQKAIIYNGIILTLVSMLVTYTTYGWGVYKVWNGTITYGTMTLFLSLSSSLSSSVESLVNMIPNTISIVNATRRIRRIISLPKEDYSNKEEVTKFHSDHAQDGIGIFVDNISFKYMNGTSVFNNINFEAYPKETIALIGPSGGGKTTAIRLLLSLIRPQSGTALICSGRNKQQTLPLNASCRSLFSYVPQGNTMFAGSIADNMRMVNETASDEEIIEVLKQACAWDFVSKLPLGINSPIKERGGGISEGQAQRLSIARALLRKSPILLLDEATSALDIETENAVLRNIMTDKYPRTTIVTTHRPSVLTICNRIYKIQNESCRILSQEEISNLQNEFLGKTQKTSD